MRRLLGVICLVLISVATVDAQLNVELISNRDYDITLNDVWGYVAPDSTEYALIGTTQGLSIVSLEKVDEPRELQFIPGEPSTWRDIKAYNDFAYVVSDNTSEGILIADLTTLPDSVNFSYFKDTLAGIDNAIIRSHNIYIDEYGLAYLAGSNLGSIIVLDLKEDPWAPSFVAKTPAPYAHDVYVRDSIVYASEINAGLLSIYDITRTDSIIKLGSTETPREFTHNAWLSDDSQKIFTTDEKSNAWVGSYDISDPMEIKELDRFRPAKTVGEGVIPHNVHVLDDYLVISYYTDGLVIVDASRPDNMIEVGNYDSYPGPSGGYFGAWGAYPFLPSGNILVSDRQTGLYVVAPSYTRGAYLEGKIFAEVTDAHADNVALLNAQIEILDDEIITPEFSGIDGTYKTGKAISGTYMVRVSHPEYHTQEVMADFENGVVTELDFVMVPKRRLNVMGQVTSAESGTFVPSVPVVLTDGVVSYETVSDEQGNFLINDVFEGPYRIFAGIWGLYTIEEIDVQEDFAGNIVLQKGYYDDFKFDNGWTVDTANEQAVWVRDMPNSQLLFGVFECNPGEDVTTDFGDQAFVTGNTGTAPQDDDVDEGTTTLTTPVMDLTWMNDPVAAFQPWLCVRFTDIESYFVLASNGIDTVTVDTVLVDGNEGYWRAPMEIHLKDHLEINATMKVHFVARDEFGTGNVVKAGLDVFSVYDAMSTSTEEVIDLIDIALFPNPTNGTFNVAFDTDAFQPDAVHVYDIYGKRVAHKPLTASLTMIQVDLVAGMYVVQVMQNEKRLATRKLIVR